MNVAPQEQFALSPHEQKFRAHLESLGDEPYDPEFERMIFDIESLTVDQATKYREQLLTCEDRDPMFIEFLEDKIAGRPVNGPRELPPES